MDRLPELARRSLAESGRAASELARRRGEPPALGDLFVSPAARDFPVEWLVAGRHPRLPGVLLVLLADVNPLLGSADVAVPGPPDPLSVRCRYGAWVAAGSLDPALRTGGVAPEHVERALGRRALVQGAGPPPREGDADPEYEDWCEEVLAPAYAALVAAHGERSAAPEPGEGEEEALAAAPPRRRPLASRRRQLAASVLLLVLFGASLGWQQGRIERLARQIGTLRSELAAAGGRAGEPLQPTEPIPNAPFVWLQPRLGLRGAPARVRLPARAASLLVVLEIGDSEPAEGYRLEVVRQDEPGSGRQVSGLRSTPLNELTVSLPGRWLAPGLYRLRLYGRDDRVPVREYDLLLSS